MPNTPYPDLTTANGGGGLTKKIDAEYINGVDLVNKLNYNLRMFSRYKENNYDDMFGIFSEKGAVNTVTNRDFYRFEKGYSYFAGQIIAKTPSANPVVGDPFTITIANNRNLNNNSVGGFDDLPMVQESDILMFGVTGRGYVMAVTPNLPQSSITCIIRPISETAVGQTYSKIKLKNYCSVIGNAHSVDSKGGRQTFITKPMMFKSSLQTFRHTFKVSNESLVNKLEVIAPDGKEYWTQTMYVDAMANAEKEIFFSMVFNEGYNETLTIVDPITLKSGVKMTDGLVNNIRTQGIYSPKLRGSVFSLGDIDNHNLELDAQQAGAEVWGYHGNKAYNDIENVLIDFIGKNVNYGSFGFANGDAKAKCIDLNFNSFTKGNRTWQNNKPNFLNDPQITNLPGFDFSEMSIIIPTSKVKDGHGNMVNRVEINVRNQVTIDGKGGTTSRRHKQVTRDWTVNDRAEDVTEIETFSEVGLSTNLTNSCLLIETI